MKQAIIFVTCLFFFSIGFAQHQEFTTYPNGLMYNDTTMRQLALIVDSLNLKFRACDLNKTYYAKYQAKGHYVSLGKGNIRAAANDMESNMPFEEFVKKYPKCKTERDLLIVKFKYKNYDKEEVVEFNALCFDGNNDHEIQIKNHSEAYDQKRINAWMFNRRDKDDYGDAELSAFYFTTEFVMPALPDMYGRMVQYSDCMVDTSGQVFSDKTPSSRTYKDYDSTSKVNTFMNLVSSKIQMPTLNENDSDYYEVYFRYGIH